MNTEQLDTGKPGTKELLEPEIKEDPKTGEILLIKIPEAWVEYIDTAIKQLAQDLSLDHIELMNKVLVYRGSEVYKIQHVKSCQYKTGNTPVQILKGSDGQDYTIQFPTKNVA
jgi:hypothetical protein